MEVQLLLDDSRKKTYKLTFVVVPMMNDMIVINHNEYYKVICRTFWLDDKGSGTRNAIVIKKTDS